MITKDSFSAITYPIVPAFGCLLLLVGMAGCSGSKPVAAGRPPTPHEAPPRKEPAPPPSTPEPSAHRTYGYRAVTDDCNCDEYTTLDEKNRIEYRFRASYAMDAGIMTSIEIEVNNNAGDTLYFDHGTVKVSSRNIAYQYNDLFIPLPELTIAPEKSDVVKLTGKEKTDKDDWHKIAGEQLTITIRGLRLGERQVKPQSVTFVPENPMIPQR